MKRLLDVGILPLMGLGFQRVGNHISNAIGWTITLFLGKRRGIEGDAASGALYIATSIIALLGTVALVGISFSGSFVAASEFAISAGINESVAAFIPLSIDGLIVVSIIILFSLSLAGQKSTVITIIIILFTALSVHINIEHIASSEGINALNRYIVGAVFPITVFLTSELVSFSLRRTTAYISKLKTYQQLVDLIGNLKTAKLQAEETVEGLADQATNMQAKIKAYETTVSNLNRDLAILAVSAEVNEDTAETIERKVNIIRIKVADPTTTQVQLALELDASQKTISRDMAELAGIVSMGNKSVTTNGVAKKGRK